MLPPAGSENGAKTERLGVGSETFVDFMRFLTTDPEIRDRYMAHRTARRLWGEL
jgi:hypothetical protein